MHISHKIARRGRVALFASPIAVSAIDAGSQTNTLVDTTHLLGVDDFLYLLSFTLIDIF